MVFANVRTADAEADKAESIDHLKNLVGLYITGQTQRKPTPKSIGHTFWLALFVGDSAGVTGGLKIEDAYAQPSQAGNLISPADRYCLSKDDIEKAFEDAFLAERQGWDQLPGDSRLYTSYAGPRTRRDISRKKNGIIGCEGSRNGHGFFPDGFCVVTNYQSASFMKYEDLAKENSDEWTGKETEPNWDSELLDTVYNVGEGNPAFGGLKYDIEPRPLPEEKPVEPNVADEPVKPDTTTEKEPAIEDESKPEVSEEADSEKTDAEKETDTGNNMVLIIVVIVLVIVIIALIVVLILRRK